MKKKTKPIPTHTTHTTHTTRTSRPATYPAAMSGPVAIDGVIYYVSAVPYEQFLDWRYSPLGHAEIDRILRSCRAVKIWFPKSSNLIATLERKNIGTVTTEPASSEQPIQ